LLACGQGSIGAAREPGVHAANNKAYLSKHLNVLSDRNGEIVQITEVQLGSPWSGSVECYRIQYLSDGLRVAGFLLKPARGELFPAIIYNRGGCREYGKIDRQSLVYLSYLCSKGYVVLASQYRGNDGGEGREEFGGRDVNDVLNLIETAKGLRYVDSERIAMIGVSRGGMMTYIAIRKGADIRAAAIISGISDLERLYQDRGSAMKKVIEELAGADRNEWKKRSAVEWPEDLSVPILILHGTGDARVSVSHATRMDELLTAAGKAHKLVLYPNGDHSLSAFREALNRALFEWLGDHLR